MKRINLVLILISAALFFSLTSRVYAEEKSIEGNEKKQSDARKNLELDEVEVKAKRDNGFVERKNKETTTQSTVTKEAINLSSPGQTSLFKAIDLLPSVQVDSSDPYGLTQSTRGIRVRGQQAIGMSTMIEGIPVWGIQSPGPRVGMLDMENIQSVTLYRGGAPSDKGLGGQNTAGVFDVSILKPSDTFGALVNQSIGAYGFLRSFARIDSGKLPYGTKFFISGSYSEADKWTGTGKTGGYPDYRYHIAFGIAQPVTSKVKMQLFVDYNNEKFHSYDNALTYNQTKDLSRYEDLDTNPDLTGNVKNDIKYYEFNKSIKKSLNVIGSISIKPAVSTLITIKPYYWTENATSLSGTSAIPGTKIAGVSETQSDFDRYGSVLEYNSVLANIDIKAGFWYESFNFPIENNYNTIVKDSLVYDRTISSRADGRGDIYSPYIKLSKDINQFHFDVGLRYLHLVSPAMIGYQSIDPDSTDPAYNYGRKTNKKWLPYAAASYSLNPEISIYASYGRNYARPHGYPGLFTGYITNKKKYAAGGVDMQYLADSVNLVTSDNYDLGLRFNNKHFYISPVLFYADYSNKLFSVYDPGIEMSVRQSIGKSRVYGAELEIGANIFENLAAYGSLSYNKSEITENFSTASNTLISSKGNQTPNTPRFLAKIGITYNLYGLEISPVAKFTDSRYGDVMNTEKIPSYWIVDLNLKYSLPPFLGLKDISAGLTIQNIFDKKYIGEITAFDDATKGSYLMGSPIAVSGCLSARF